MATREGFYGSSSLRDGFIMRVCRILLWGVAGLNAASYMVSLRRLLSPGALTPAGWKRSKALTGYLLEGMKVRGGFYA